MDLTRFLALALILMPALASATNDPKPQPAPTSKSSSVAGAAAASKSRSRASITDESSSDDHSLTVYEAEKQAAATAAALESGFCGSGGISAQARGAGVSFAEQSYICARIELAKMHLEIAASHFAAAEALRAATSKGPQGGGSLAQDAVIRGRAEVALAELEITKATARLGEDDTKLRSFFVRFFGSLPRPFSYLAPR